MSKQKFKKVYSKNNNVIYDKPNEKQKFPHFRKYFKANHPALITDEYSTDEWSYRKVMHSDRDGRHLNEKVSPNPNKRDSKSMYIAHRVRHDKKEYFSSWRYPWKYKK